MTKITAKILIGMLVLFPLILSYGYSNPPLPPAAQAEIVEAFWNHEWTGTQWLAWSWGFGCFYRKEYSNCLPENEKLSFP